ncbi:hypothetical protein OpiT1DRAFT_05438 [Opitutaceae bacterium TAV1]|nr:hypothetical protein OpiT1DRAFT_05438 [Opitutaceae bacterium TAV1]
MSTKTNPQAGLRSVPYRAPVNYTTFALMRQILDSSNTTLLKRIDNIIRMAINTGNLLPDLGDLSDIKASLEIRRHRTDRGRGNGIHRVHFRIPQDLIPHLNKASRVHGLTPRQALSVVISWIVSKIMEDARRDWPTSHVSFTEYTERTS